MSGDDGDESVDFCRLGANQREHLMREVIESGSQRGPRATTYLVDKHKIEAPTRLYCIMTAQTKRLGRAGESEGNELTRM